MAKSISVNYLFNILNTASGILFPLITFPYVTRVLGAGGIGQLNFFNSIIGYIVLFSSLGIATYASKEIAIVRDNKQLMTQKSVEILLLHLFLTVLGYLAVIAIACITPKVQDNQPLFWILSLNLIFTAVGCEWFYVAIEEFKYIAIRGFIIKSLCVIFLFVYVKTPSDLLYYGLYTVVGSLGGNVVNIVRLPHYIDRKTLDWKHLHIFTHLLPSIQIFGLGLITSVYLNLDTIMLGFLSDNESVAYYTGATKLTKLLMAFTTSLTVVVLPRLSNIIGKSDRSAYEDLVAKSYKYIVLISAPITAGLFILSEPLVILFCGNEFLPAITCLKIISPIILLISTSYLICQSFYPLGKLKCMYIAAIVAAFANFTLNCAFIPIMQERGAALATIVAEAASLLIYFYYAKQILHLRIINRSVLKVLLSTIVMSLALLTLRSLINNIVVEIFVIPLLGAVTYISSLWMLREKLLYDVMDIIICKVRRNANKNQRDN